ncbi:hypothetical protein Tco_1445492, partial [Tanacetum coccineum]
MLLFIRRLQFTTQGKTKGNSKLKGGLDYSSDHKHDGRVRFVKSSTLIGLLKLRGYAAGRKAQRDVDFTLKALTQQKQGHIKGLPSWQSINYHNYWSIELLEGRPIMEGSVKLKLLVPAFELGFAICISSGNLPLLSL